MNESTARKAAKWWADQLRGHAKLDNGDPSETGGMVFALATMLQASEKNHQSSEQIDKFEDALTNIITEHRTEYMNISVDYHPDMTLQLAADVANLDLGMTTLPWKTGMSISGDTISVACGYGAKAETI